MKHPFWGTHWFSQHLPCIPAAQMAMRGLGTSAKITTRMTAPQMARFLISSSSMIPTCLPQWPEPDGGSAIQRSQGMRCAVTNVRYILEEMSIVFYSLKNNLRYFKFEVFQTQRFVMVCHSISVQVDVSGTTAPSQKNQRLRASSQ